MKIVMDFRKYDGVVGGVEQGVFQVTKYLTEHDHPVVMLCKKNRLSAIGELFNGFTNLKIVPLDVTNHIISSRNSLLDSTVIQDIAEEELAELAGTVRKHCFKKGNMIFAADQTCRNLHILQSGEIKIFMVSEVGREQIIHFLKPFVFFGEEILFGENKYEANAQALCETVLYDLGKKDLETFILTHPQVGIAMLACFGERLKKLMKMIGDLALKDIQCRVVCRLVQMAYEEGEKTKEGIVIEGFTHEGLASHIGTVREPLSRCLSRLQNAHLIKLGRKKIVVQNIDALKDLSQSSNSCIPVRSGL